MLLLLLLLPRRFLFVRRARSSNDLFFPFIFNNVSENLYLESNELEGTVPTELQDLSNMRAMNFAGNSLTGSIPTKICDLAELQELSTVGTLVDCNCELCQ
jgi:hypothetical protein